MSNFQNWFIVFQIAAQAVISKDERLASWELWDCGAPSLSILPESALKGNS